VYFKNNAIIIPYDVINGLNLMWHSDLVISGGGTMNREAAALGVPVYSIFKGKIGDVDKYLSETGRLILIENVDDIERKIRIKKRKRVEKVNNLNSIALQSIVNNLEFYISEITNSERNQKSNRTNEKRLSTSRRSK